MSNQNNTLFGKILSGPVRRDAYHQAIIPLIIASKDTKSGDWVKLNFGNRTSVIKCDKNHKNAIGFVDPFLKENSVPVGSKVYIFLKQGLVGDMSHHWTSPFFNDVDIEIDLVTREPIQIQEYTDSMLESEQWLINLCKENHIDFERIKSAKDEDDLYDISVTIGDNNVGQGECYLDDLLEEFANHIKIYKNIDVKRDNLYYIDFSCMGC